MTNYEYIMQGGIDALMEYVEKRDEDDCSICVHTLNDDGRCVTNCLVGQRKWLEAKYVEKDSEIEAEEA